MSNNDGVILYYSSVSSSTKAKKDTQSLKWLLEKKHTAFDEVDVATKPPALFSLLQKKSGKKTLPQLYVDGKFIGVIIIILFINVNKELIKIGSNRVMMNVKNSKK